MLLFLCVVLSPSSFFESVLTILASNGRKMNEINTLAQAIDHARYGDGTALYAGSKLIQEINNSVQFRRFSNNTNGLIYLNLVKSMKESYLNNGVGTLLKKEFGSIESDVEALGFFDIFYDFDINYNCTFNTQRTEKNCSISSDIFYHGESLWEFKRKSTYTTAQNNVLESLPYFFVKLRGKFAPFKVKYNFSDSLSFRAEFYSNYTIIPVANNTRFLECTDTLCKFKGENDYNYY